MAMHDVVGRSSVTAWARGRLLALETQKPLAGYKIELYDQDIAKDDFLGSCVVDSQGKFGIHFDESAFRDFARLDIEKEPELELRVHTPVEKKVGSIGIMRSKEADFRDAFVSEKETLTAPVVDPEAAGLCPTCGALYRAGFSTCSDCQVPIRPL